MQLLVSLTAKTKAVQCWMTEKHSLCSSSPVFGQIQEPGALPDNEYDPHKTSAQSSAPTESTREPSSPSAMPQSPWQTPKLTQTQSLHPGQHGDPMHSSVSALLSSAQSAGPSFNQYEYETNATGSMLGSSRDVIEILLEDYDLVQVKDGIVMVRRVATLEDVLADFKIVEMEEVELPEGVTPLSPILQLTPENHDFDTPVHLIIPVCVGATKVWRSCADGWEELGEGVFFQGYVRVRLTHFCLIFAGDRQVKAADTVAVPFYRHGDNGIQVRWAVCHLDCNGCVESLDRKRRAYLDGFLRCEGDFELGTKMHQSKIEIRSNTGAPGVHSEQSSDEVILDFARFPLMRPRDCKRSFLPRDCFLLRLEAPPWGYRQELIAGMVCRQKTLFRVWTPLEPTEKKNVSKGIFWKINFRKMGPTIFGGPTAHSMFFFSVRCLSQLGKGGFKSKKCSV